MWYRIKKGRHTSCSFPKLIWDKNSMDVEVMFTDSCRYLTSDSRNQEDWNKLIGYSRGFHHKNSVRVGWRWNHEKEVIELAEYRYINGKRTYSLIGETVPYKYTSLSIYIHKGKFPKWGYVLWPYFGGNERVPQDISIYIRYKIT